MTDVHSTCTAGNGYLIHYECTAMKKYTKQNAEKENEKMTTDKKKKTEENKKESFTIRKKVPVLQECHFLNRRNR